MGLSPCYIAQERAAHKGAGGAAETRPERRVDWPEYGGSRGQHYSPLKQIRADNVSRLKKAWEFDSGEEGSGLEASPMVVGRYLYVRRSRRW